MPRYRVLGSQVGRERYRRVIRTVRSVAAVLLAVTAMTAAGLYLLDDPSLSIGERVTNALWNSVNTLTTIGDYTDLDLRQRYFLIALMAVLIAVGTYSISSLAGILSSPEVVAFRENLRMDRKLESLAGHVIVAGYGEVGALVAAQLRERGETVLVVDESEALAESASGAGFLVVQGMAEHEETLAAARVALAKAMLIEIAAAADSGRKLSMTLMARAMAPKLYISVLSSVPAGGKWFKHAGASEVHYVDSLIADAVVASFAKAGVAI
ncbi:MAG: NAD-binding protein [Acidobacteria bacterium]|jgi:voltage-gated potassium channel Kch|nr:NAD-binding protein [Acidobacteriota bacterium]MCU0253652.1 NAD-binding protein [Acidobacteriota bacterium]